MVCVRALCRSLCVRTDAAPTTANSTQNSVGEEEEHTHTNRHEQTPYGTERHCKSVSADVRTKYASASPVSVRVFVAPLCVSLPLCVWLPFMFFFVLFFEQKINEDTTVWLAWEELLMLTYP